MTLPMRTIQKINSIKETLAAQAEWEYAEALQQQTTARELLEKLVGELDEAACFLSSRQAYGLSGSELHEWDRWMLAQRSKIFQQQEVCRQMDLLAEQMRVRLMERHQDKEVWENLQERRAETIEQEFRRLEQAELDEVGNRNRKTF